MALRSKYYVWLILFVSIALFGLIYPIYVIRPFRHQGPNELQAALFVLRYRGIAETITAVAILIVLIKFWPRAKAAGIIATTLVLACAVLSRVNVYEIMFHPVGQPAFEPASQTHLDNGERVITVKLQTTARAYPIRVIAYHHIVNDVVDGVPIAATY